MASDKVGMSLDEIIKSGKKGGQQQKRGKKGGVNARKGKVGQTKLGGKKGAGVQKTGNVAATKRLVNKLVQKALAQNGGAARNNGNKGRVIRKVGRNGNNQSRGISNRSQVIKKSPRTETVIVRKIIKPRPQPRQQVIREVIVQEPARRVITQPARRFNNKPRVVYVEKQGPQRSSFGGGNNFQQRKRFVSRRQNSDPFFEPVNYLQRF